MNSPFCGPLAALLLLAGFVLAGPAPGPHPHPNPKPQTERFMLEALKQENPDLVPPPQQAPVALGNNDGMADNLSSANENGAVTEERQGCLGKMSTCRIGAFATPCCPPLICLETPLAALGGMPGKWLACLPQPGPGVTFIG